MVLVLKCACLCFKADTPVRWMGEVNFAWCYCSSW